LAMRRSQIGSLFESERTIAGAREHTWFKMRSNYSNYSLRIGPIGAVNLLILRTCPLGSVVEPSLHTERH
jgi:hypothetical protein